MICLQALLDSLLIGLAYKQHELNIEEAVRIYTASGLFFCWLNDDSLVRTANTAAISVGRIFPDIAADRAIVFIMVSVNGNCCAFAMIGNSKVINGLLAYEKIQREAISRNYA